jgi:hypothetical protein
MIDAFDVMAFGVFAALLVAAVIVVVGLGSLPGWIARKRGHPQAVAVNVAGWLGLATAGLLWPFALIWAFLKLPAAPSGSALHPEPLPAPGPDPKAEIVRMQARLDALEAALREARAGKEVVS